MPFPPAVLVPAIVALAATGCGIVPLGSRARADFFPLAPESRWEYVVNRRAGSEDADRALRRIERSAGGRPVVLADLGRPDDPGTAAAVAAITAWLRC